MSLFSRKSHLSTPRPLTGFRIVVALGGAALAFYGMRKDRGVLRKLASTAGLGLLAKSLGATSLAGAPAMLLSFLDRAGLRRLNV